MGMVKRTKDDHWSRKGCNQARLASMRGFDLPLTAARKTQDWTPTAYRP